MTMRFASCLPFILLATLFNGTAVGQPGPRKRPDKPVKEDPPAAVKEVLDRYLKAIDTQDFKAMSSLADVPWLDTNRNIIRTRDKLHDAFVRVEKQWPKPEVEFERSTEFVSAKTAGARLKETDRKFIGDLTGEDGWGAVVEPKNHHFDKRTILIRVQDGKAAIVAGPLKQNQLIPGNRIHVEADALLDKAEKFVLYSIDPARRDEKDGYHGWHILGKSEVKDKAQRKEFADALRLSAEDNPGIVAACFQPRHGIRLTAGEKTVDLVICFECLSVYIFINDKQVPGFLTTHSPQFELDVALIAAGVPLPKSARTE
jgi:hypothetical protein